MKFRRLFGWSALAIVGITATYGALVLFGFISLPGAEMSETMVELKDVDGAGFEVIYTNSDTLAKEEWVNVYVYDSSSRTNWFSRLVHPKTLLFSYDPGYPAETPAILAAGRRTIRILLSHISSVRYQSPRWKELSIYYKIAKVDYP